MLNLDCSAHSHVPTAVQRKAIRLLNCNQFIHNLRLFQKSIVVVRDTRRSGNVANLRELRLVSGDKPRHLVATRTYHDFVSAASKRGLGQ